jgi:hypothetical protein
MPISCLIGNCCIRTAESAPLLGTLLDSEASAADLSEGTEADLQG